MQGKCFSSPKLRTTVAGKVKCILKVSLNLNLMGLCDSTHLHHATRDMTTQISVLSQEGKCALTVHRCLCYPRGQSRNGGTHSSFQHLGD